VYRYSGDEDVLDIYFTRATEGLIDHSRTYEDWLNFDYTAKGQLVSIEILDASKITNCHFFNTLETFDQKR
jgi:uncharacterized protein YuzE